MHFFTSYPKIYSKSKADRWRRRAMAGDDLPSFPAVRPIPLSRTCRHRSFTPSRPSVCEACLEIPSAASPCGTFATARHPKQIAALRMRSEVLSQASGLVRAASWARHAIGSNGVSLISCAPDARDRLLADDEGRYATPPGLRTIRLTPTSTNLRRIRWSPIIGSLRRFSS